MIDFTDSHARGRLAPSRACTGDKARAVLWEWLGEPLGRSEATVSYFGNSPCARAARTAGDLCHRAGAPKLAPSAIA